MRAQYVSLRHLIPCIHEFRKRQNSITALSIDLKGILHPIDALPIARAISRIELCTEKASEKETHFPYKFLQRPHGHKLPLAQYIYIYEFPALCKLFFLL